MDIGFIGLGQMGFHMARRLVEAGHRVVVFDTRREAIDRLVALGAEAAGSVREVADRVETVMASLPTPDIVLAVAAGKGGLIEGNRVRRFVDLSTTGSVMANRIFETLKERDIVQIDSPVSGGVNGAEKGTLAVMVSGPRAEVDGVEPALTVIGKVFFIGERPGRRADHEALQQFSLGDRHGGDLRGYGDGRQGRARSAHHARRDQRRQRPQHRDRRQVPQSGCCPGPSISVSPAG